MGRGEKKNNVVLGLLGVFLQKGHAWAWPFCRAVVHDSEKYCIIYKVLFDIYSNWPSSYDPVEVTDVCIMKNAIYFLFLANMTMQETPFFFDP